MSLSCEVPKSDDVDGDREMVVSFVFAEAAADVVLLRVVGVELCTVLLKLELEYVTDEDVGVAGVV